MAASKSIVCIFTILFSLSVVLAQDSTPTASSSSSSGSSTGLPSIPGLHSTPGLPSIPGIPSMPGMPSFGSGFPSFPFMPSFGSGFQSFPGMPSFPGFPGFFRHRRQADGTADSEHDGPSLPANEHHPEHEHQDRLFFTIFPTVTSCNYTANPGSSCSSCNQALTCLSSNVGLRRNCHGLFRFCNNGRCSLNRGSACDATTSTSSSSSSSSSTSTTTTTTTTTTTVAPGK